MEKYKATKKTAKQDTIGRACVRTPTRRGSDTKIHNVQRFTLEASPELHNKFRRRTFQYWMQEVRRDFNQWFEHKPPFVQTCL